VFFPRIIQSLRRVTMNHAAVAALMWVAACGGSSPTAPPSPPALSVICPSNLEASTFANAPVALSYTTPVASGGTLPVTVTCTPTPGALFPSGGSTVTCAAADAVGRTASCGFSVNVVNIARLSRTRFMAFGDSLTEGKLSLTPTQLVDSPPHSYPAKLLGLLTERYTSQQVIVINEGFGGERADESYLRFRAALSQHRPEAVLLMHGVNDLNGIHDERVRSAADAVEDMVKQAKSRGLEAFVATLPPFGSGPKASCRECVEPFNALIRSIVSHRGATLVDVFAAWAGRTDLMGADGIHPTEAGYEVISTAFFDAIGRTLETTQPPR
jgi:lysophospholipase L1-like esterase